MCAKPDVRQVPFFWIGAGMLGSALLTWKVFFHRRRIGFAERTGKRIDDSLKGAAHYLDKASCAIEETAEDGKGRTFGRGVDEAIGEAKAAVNKVVILVQGASKR